MDSETIMICNCVYSNILDSVPCFIDEGIDPYTSMHTSKFREKKDQPKPKSHLHLGWKISF